MNELNAIAVNDKVIVKNYTTNVNQGHNHILQISDMPSHNHNIGGEANTGLAFEKDDFVININKGTMINAELTYTHDKINCDDMFLNNICDCIVSRFAGHDINLFKAGNSNNLKEMILNFLKKETK